MDASAGAEEHNIWHGSPSQWLNFKAFFLCGLAVLLIAAAITVLMSAGSTALGNLRDPAVVVLAALLVIILAIAVKRYLDIRCRVYEISDQRVRVTRGILSKRMDGLELYRVEDALLLQPVLLRLVGKGNIELVSSDRTNPSVVIEAVPSPRWLWDEVRHAVEACRDRKRTRVIDFDENESVFQG